MEVKQKANLEHKRCADGHGNDDFDTMWKFSFDSKGYGINNRSRIG